MEGNIKTKFLATVVAAATAAGTAAAALTITRSRPSITGPVSMLASTSATNGARSPTSAVIQVASPVAANSDTTGKSDNSYSAPRLTSRQVPPTTPSRRGNSPIRGLGRCAVARVTRSTMCCYSPAPVSPTATSRQISPVSRKAKRLWVGRAALVWKSASPLTGPRRSSICTWISEAVSVRSPVSTTDYSQAICVSA